MMNNNSANRMLVVALAVLNILWVSPFASAQLKTDQLAAWAVEIAVPDLEHGVDFFVDNLGYSVIGRFENENHALLQNGDALLVLKHAQVRIAAQTDGTARTTINFYVDDIAGAITRLAKRGVEFTDPEPRKVAVGLSACFRDPAGNAHHLMQLDFAREDAGPVPRVFNVGVTLTDIQQAEEFYANRLGLDIYSRVYLPNTLPFHRRGHFSIVVHGWADRPRPDDASNAGLAILLVVPDLNSAVATLRKNGLDIADREFDASPFGKVGSTKDPAGNVLRLIELNDAWKTRHSDKGDSSLADLSWMRGRWIARQDDEFLEETWSEPVGDCMVGTFRWLRGGKVWMYELMTIRMKDGRPVFRLKHFNAEMDGWEAADEALTYPMRSQDGRTAIFEDPGRDAPRQFVYERTGSDSLAVRIHGFEDGRLTAGTTYQFSRATTSP